MAKKDEKLKTATETYTILGSLGGGGAGEVYSVLDESGSTLAAKILRAGLSKQKLKRFQNELMFGVKEDHPNLIKVLDFGLTSQETPFYIMPLASATLRSMMKRGVEESRKLRLFSDILDGLEAAHLKRVFHRDLKPENLLYFSNTNKLLVADFGIAHFEEDQLHTHVETLPAERLANFEYAAPEQRRSGIEVDARSDIFALGLILSELFTGNVPHGLGAIKISEKASTFAYLDGLVDRMLQQDPNRRYSSIREIKNDLVARGNDFIESQKLDQLKKTVVKESETTDPLVVDPPSIVDVQFTSSGLQIKLSQPVTNDWIHTFQNAPLGGLMGYGPERHSFRGDTASIPVPDRLAQQVINQFKGYLDIVNQIYERETKQKAKDAVLREASRLANKIAQEEHTAAIQKSLKW